jgi:hypothetical protein
MWGSEMKNRCLLIGLLTTCVIAVARPVSAQLWRGRSGGYYDDGGMASAVALASSNRATSNQMQMAAQNQQSAQQAARQQSSAVQSGIRNTMTAQAQNRTNTIEDQRQSYKDWWFQTKQQQAERPANATRSQVPMAGGYGMRQPIGGGFTYEDFHPPVDLDIIKWPTVLQEKAFASERAQIETPYRRSPPGLSVPTATDYRDMVKTVEVMRGVLEWRLGQNGGLPTVDYEQAKAFLNNLAQEAQERAGRGGTSLNPDRNPAHASLLLDNLQWFII